MTKKIDKICDFFCRMVICWIFNRIAIWNSEQLPEFIDNLPIELQ